jgi:hypothetical protein
MRRVSSFCRSGSTKGVLARHFQIAMARDLGCFHGAAANRLSTSDIRPAEGVRSRGRQNRSIPPGLLGAVSPECRKPTAALKRTPLLEYRRAWNALDFPDAWAYKT